jgi:hypothetical protein
VEGSGIKVDVMTDRKAGIQLMQLIDLLLNVHVPFFHL